jgi:GNAT superfamily N-acetyltransferase
MRAAQFEVRIRRAVSGEAELLSNIARASKSYWGYSAEQIELWRDDLSFTARSIETCATFVAEVDNVPVGVVQINSTTEPWDLAALWVHPDYIGRGIGKALLHKALMIAREADQGSLSIDSDPYAEAFYLALGALRVGERRAPIEGEAKRVRPQLSLSTRSSALITLSNSPVIRSIEAGDRDAWQPLWDGYNAFYGRKGDTALAPDITHVTWQRFFDSNEPVFALVAEAEGQLVGLVHYLFHRSTTRIELTCYLQDLFTLESERGRGVGRLLIEGVYQAARAAGISRVYWQTQETNAAGRLLYDKVAKHAGFIVYAHECIK